MPTEEERLMGPRGIDPDIARKLGLAPRIIEDKTKENELKVQLEALKAEAEIKKLLAEKEELDNVGHAMDAGGNSDLREDAAYKRDMESNRRRIAEITEKFQRKSAMFLIRNEAGEIICCVTDANTARVWCERFNWTQEIVPNADDKEPVKMRRGYIDLLQPSKPATWSEYVIVFNPNDPANRPNSSAVQEGDVFYRSNLENFAFAITEGEDVEVLAMKYWSDLHERGLDLQRQSNGTFRIIRTKSVSVESPQQIKQNASVQVIRNPVAPPPG